MNSPPLESVVVSSGDVVVSVEIVVVMSGVVGAISGASENNNK